MHGFLTNPSLKFCNPVKVQFESSNVLFLLDEIWVYFKVSTVFVLPRRHASIMFHCGDSVSFRSDSDDLKVASPVFLWPRSWYGLIGVGGEQQSESLYLYLAFCQIRECLPWLPWYGESCLWRRSQILQTFSVDASYVGGGGWGGGGEWRLEGGGWCGSKTLCLWGS